MRETEVLRAQAEEALTRVLVEREQTRAVLRAKEREELAEFREEADRLRRAIRTLSPPKQRAPAVQAGPRALNKIKAALKRGPLAQAAITHETGLNDGTVSYGLRALVESGEIEPTGKREKGSRVFALRAKNEAAA